ncbi:MAG: alpha/beta hydrolase [Candidatus Dormibacteraeota bacterium]|nr:alpha/beta hydrolase [Candidatus Dormibacteraeota bacterium]
MVAFALLHSPSVGPSTWHPVAEELRRRGHAVAVPDVRAVASSPPPYAERVVQLATAQCAALNGDALLVAVGHSNAGLFLPALAHAIGARMMVFVDASVPPDAGLAEMVPARFAAELRRKAVDGVLPRWTDWWSEEDVAALFADAETRRRVVDEQPQLPLAYYEERVAVPEDWASTAAAYLLFGPPYTEVAYAAGARGWPVAHVPGEHLHMVVDPHAVTDALLDLTAQLSEAR